MNAADELVALFNEEVKRFSYKPGFANFRLNVIYDHLSPKAVPIRLALTWSMEDWKDVHIGLPVAPGMLFYVSIPLRQFEYSSDPTYDILKYGLRDFEMHELDEYLQKDGVAVDDPHER